MASHTIFVVGASGTIGAATVKALASDAFASCVNVKAGVRDPVADKSKALEAKNVEVVHADMGNKEGMTKAFAGASAVFVVTPGHIDRTQLAINAIDAAKDAGVAFIAVVSVATSGTDSIFGRQFGPIEAHVKGCGVPYSLLRLPFFLDNLWGSQASIKSEGKLYAPCRADAPWTPVAVQDAGLAAATILAEPTKHANTTYTLTTGTMTYGGIAAALTKALGKDITFVQVPYDAAKKTFLGFGMPEWQVDGVMELFHYFDAKSGITNNPTDHIKTITGKPPLTVETWFAPIVGAFQ
jgi:uncharacterized protein YbjT (DUF2867 family)